MITTISFLFEKVFQKKLKFYPIAMVVLWQFKLKVHVSRFLTLVFSYASEPLIHMQMVSISRRYSHMQKTAESTLSNF